jgi:hypothetical protein
MNIMLLLAHFLILLIAQWFIARYKLLVKIAGREFDSGCCAYYFLTLSAADLLTYTLLISILARLGELNVFRVLSWLSYKIGQVHSSYYYALGLS